MVNSPTSIVVLLMAIVLLTFTYTSVCADGEVLPWGVERIRAYCVWDNNHDMTVDAGACAGQYVGVAIIDSGIDYYVNYSNKVYHPDLADNIAEGKGFRYYMGQIQELADYEDLDGHGTLVAGTIVAVDNSIGVIGTAPKAEIYTLKTVAWDYREVVAAINWVVQNINIYNIKIISISLGLDNNYTEFRQACDNAYAAGVLLIAAAGNDNGPVNYPAAYDSVIAVGAVYPNDTRYEYSNFGSELEFVAPGVNISSTGLNEGYATDTGTSFACPHVTGAAALIFSSKIDPAYDADNDCKWDNVEVRQKLQDTALDLGDTGKDDYYGYGLVNAWYANQRPPGDVNTDHHVNYLDAIIVSAAFGSEPGDPNWDPRADITINNIVNYLDSIIVGDHFGETDP